MALVVILVVSVCAALLYDITFRFARVSLPQRNTYMNHTTVLDAIQTVRGYILSVNSADGVAMHPPGFDYEKKKITSLSDIRFPRSELSSDTMVSNGAGTQRLVVQVYDMYYNADNLDASLLNDPIQMKDLPPPIDMVGAQASGGENVYREGEKTISDTGSNDDISGGGTLDPQKYGAYLVRALLYDVDGNASPKLVRMAEEAFVQVLE
ncbi:MAG: hypothetical protein LBT15_00595 [Synergistaceae bacterium]|jgi:hypothetical protein|nr:hypothetical protein [Synergistaceae bacterium]